MKEIKAYIRRERLDEVVDALARIEGLSGVSVSAVAGFGRSRGVLRFVDLETHIKLEATCADHIVDDVVEAIVVTAQTGQRGDGKVFVSPVHQAVRIQDGTMEDDL